MKRSQEMMSLVRWMFDEAGLVAESMALTSGGDRVAEDEDGGWCVGNNGGRYGRKRGKAQWGFQQIHGAKKTKVAHAGERRCKFRGEDAQYDNYPCSDGALPWYKSSRIAPKRPRLGLEAKAFDKLAQAPTPHRAVPARFVAVGWAGRS